MLGKTDAASAAGLYRSLSGERRRADAQPGASYGDSCETAEGRDEADVYVSYDGRGQFGNKGPGVYVIRLVYRLYRQ